MKCGIMTFHNTLNYGASLQAYALCKAIREMNVDCEIIDYQCESIVKREQSLDVLRGFAMRKHKEKRELQFKSFMDQTGMISEQAYSAQNIQEANKKYEVFVSGSDMIWELPYTDNDWNYFLLFAENQKRRISYASSVKTSWGSYSDKVFELLKRYDAIGVRERDINALLHNNGIDSRVVADPTMLIGSKGWSKIAADNGEKDYVLVYFPTKRLIESAKAYAKSHQKKVFVIRDFKRIISGYKTVRIYDPSEWLGYIKNADAVFTNSYHGTLFSLYFNKQLWVEKKLNKIVSIFEILDLTDHFLSINSNLDLTIDYMRVNSGIDAFQCQSRKFLANALNVSIPNT